VNKWNKLTKKQTQKYVSDDAVGQRIICMNVFKPYITVTYASPVDRYQYCKLRRL